MIPDITPKLGPPQAAYVHIPFCRSKCFYCDFNSVAGEESRAPGYVSALISEIRSAPVFGAPLSSVYFGGGTPTILRAGDLARVLREIVERFGVTGDVEVTIEANPGTVDFEKLRELRTGGFNRLSIGVQSFDDATLVRLGRIHTGAEAVEAFGTARRAGFESISIDLMYGLPSQDIDNWQRTLGSAVALLPEHISLYELTVEEGTPFGNLKRRCKLELPDESLQIEMYTAAIESLRAAGYEHYEISNFALPGHRSRHNQVYWRNESYYGLGAGASGYVGGVRYTNQRAVDSYIERARVSAGAVESSETVTGRQSMGETVMLGLRMMDGVDLAAFQDRYGVELTDVYASEVNDMLGRGLIELSERRMKLTWDGLLIANEVSADFL